MGEAKRRSKMGGKLSSEIQRTPNAVICSLSDTAACLADRETDLAGVVIQIGAKGLFTADVFRKAVQGWRLVISETAFDDIRICVGGYEDDARELWEIPEASDFVVRWAAAAPIDGHMDRLDPQSLWLIMKCCGRDMPIEDLAHMIATHRAHRA